MTEFQASIIIFELGFIVGQLFVMNRRRRP